MPRTRTPREGDWMLTVRQAIGGLPGLVRASRPDLHLPGAQALTAELLDSMGVTGIIWDVDGTLMPCRHPEIDPGLRPAFLALQSSAGVRQVILSNSGESRFRQLGGIFAPIPVLKGYRTPAGILFRRREGEVDAWSDGREREGPDSGAVPIRKPSTVLIEFALRELRCESPGAAIMVGDQYLTDVAPATMCGVRAVKVPTLRRDSFPVPVRILQRVDALLHRLGAATT
jgi:predicted HAD superfamily phosphohydrolase YqeG